MHASVATCLVSIGAATVVAMPQNRSDDAAMDWPNYRGDASLLGVAKGTLGNRFEVAWTLETEGAITSSPVVSGGIVYVGSSDGALYAVRADTGKEVWSYGTDDIIEAPPLVHGGRVYVGSNDFYMYALDAATGKLAWKYETGDKIMGSANTWTSEKGELLIIFGSYDNKLHAVNASTGEKVWEYETSNYVNGTPAIEGGKIVFGGCDAVMHVVSAKTGKATETVELGDECHVAGSVALADGRAYFGHYGNEFVCVDLAKAAVVWRYGGGDQAFFSSPAIGQDKVVFGGRDRSLHCAKRSDGEKVWTFPTRRKVDASPVICGGKVVFGSGDGRLYVLELATGKQVFKYEIGRPVYSSPAVSRGWIFVGSNDKRLYAFRPLER
ncbi:MAG: PQQ-binding-like beta-propeller repeat protein [Planctomycetes bacterium]|nr:PQQ-binding-like beta-propeller repeat protein [Planctomycetota bacterium]MCB9890508.1 PQQ-binding-like beta-propeller repeat protein [Planctomycetota bacterium]MCB9917749.1 PQQ-binding-like beta-propeller repeat protein [Planctomycetota bacterium]